MSDIKKRYDKNLKKYHIEYNKLKDKGSYRYDMYKAINERYDMAMLIETHLGSVNEPDQLQFARLMEGMFAKYGLRYQVRPIEVKSNKQMFGFLNFGGKGTDTHYAITCLIPKHVINKEMFEDLFCEFDVQVGYKMLMMVDEFFDDMMKGYLDNVFDAGYFGDSFYDSRIFDKFLSTEDLTEL